MGTSPNGTFGLIRGIMSTVLRTLVGGMVLSGLLSFSVGVSCASGSVTTDSAKTLNVSDLPAGFQVISPPLTPQLCSGLNLPKNSGRHVTIGFRSNPLTITEALATSDSARSTYRELDEQYSACRSIRPVNHLQITGTGKRLGLSRIGDQSQAFSFKLKVNGSAVNEDLVLFRKSRSCGVVEFIAVGQPLDPKEVQLVGSIAASRADITMS